MELEKDKRKEKEHKEKGMEKLKDKSTYNELMKSKGGQFIVIQEP